MLYQISRGGQTYGPYTVADLKRYVESGHVLLTDLAKSDEMTDWVTVAQVLHPAETPAAAPQPSAYEPVYGSGYAAAPQAAYMPVAQFQDPPNLHWGLVLLFDFLSFGLFQIAWNFVLSAWLKRVQRNSQALLYYMGGYGLTLLNTGLSIPIYIAMMNHQHHSSNLGLSILGIVAWALRLVARFDMKSKLEEHFNTLEPIGFRMSGVLTFFFGGIYIQSKLNEINQIKLAMRFGQFGR